VKVGAALKLTGGPVGSLWTGFGKGAPSHLLDTAGTDGPEWFLFVETLTPVQSFPNLSKQHPEDVSKRTRVGVGNLLDRTRGGAGL